MEAHEIVELRGRLGFTQEQLAACIQSRQNTVALWEMGRHKPSRVYERLLSQLQVKAAETAPAAKAGKP